jgi:hypothetical protein
VTPHVKSVMEQLQVVLHAKTSSIWIAHQICVKHVIHHVLNAVDHLQITVNHALRLITLIVDLNHVKIVTPPVKIVT